MLASEHRRIRLRIYINRGYTVVLPDAPPKSLTDVEDIPTYSLTDEMHVGMRVQHLLMAFDQYRDRFATLADFHQDSNDGLFVS